MSQDIFSKMGIDPIIPHPTPSADVEMQPFFPTMAADRKRFSDSYLKPPEYNTTIPNAGRSIGTIILPNPYKPPAKTKSKCVSAAPLPSQAKASSSEQDKSPNFLKKRSRKSERPIDESGNCDKTTPDGDNGDDSGDEQRLGSRRQLQLSRNRVVATKYRSKKQGQLATLAAQEKDIEGEHADLVEHYGRLRNEALSLKFEALKHSHCDCTLIQRYLAEDARRVAERYEDGVPPTTDALDFPFWPQEPTTASSSQWTQDFSMPPSLSTEFSSLGSHDDQWTPSGMQAQPEEGRDPDIHDGS